MENALVKLFLEKCFRNWNHKFEAHDARGLIDLFGDENIVSLLSALVGKGSMNEVFDIANDIAKSKMPKEVEEVNE